MDLLDLLWNAGQQSQINSIHEHVAHLRIERDLMNWDLRKVRELADENLELKLRLGMLVRLLIAKGVITAEEYAGLINLARPSP
jgi:hypothetical protein